jgi:apolipoprotein N-acyltransferase
VPDGPLESRLSRRLALAALSGVLVGLTTPSTSLILLLPVALVPLMLAVSGATVRGAMIAGQLFGVCFWLTTIQWIAYTVHHFGGFSRPLAGLALLLGALFVAVPFAAMAGLVAMIRPVQPAAAAVVWAAAWVLQEAVRSTLLGGFPWALLAAPLVMVPPLAQSAALGGVFLPGSLIVLTNGFVAGAWRSAALPRKALFAAGAILLPAAAWGLGALRIEAAARASAPVLPPLRLSLLQPNVEQAVRFTAAASERTYQDLLEQTRAVARADRPDVVVWPESAAPWSWQTSRRFQADLTALCREERIAVLFNTVWSDAPDDDEAPYYNSALLVTPAGPVLPPYHKQRLVPFGEYVPFGALLRRIRPISQAVPGSFSPGPGGPPIPLGPWRLGGAVCYEVVYPWIARDHAGHGANLLFTLTNDAWFGTLSARRQHWQGAAFRSIETGMPLVRAAITGITGWVDAVGQGHWIPPDRKGSMTVTLGGSAGLSRPIPAPPAVAAGTIFPWVCAAGLFVCILRVRVFQPRKTAGAASAARRGESNDE